MTIISQGGVIYTITNTVNGKVYIGQTVQHPIRRWYAHLSMLRSKRHFNTYLQASWNKYGEQAFKFSVQENVSTIEEMNQAECRYIVQYRTRGISLYNITDGGMGAARGVTTQETREKIRAALIGKARSVETIEKVRASLLGKPPSEAAQRANAARQGTKVTESVRQTIAAANLARWGRTYQVHSPDGSVFRVINLTEFSRTHGLNTAHMYNVANGKRKQYRGWTVMRIET